MAASARYLYLTRHGEATPGEAELSGNGRRQAVLLGDRLRSAQLTAVHHGPLRRAAETAQLISGRLNGVRTEESEAAGDYLPYLPSEHELPPETAAATLDKLARAAPGEHERDRGAQLARAALSRFTGPSADGHAACHELVVTHNFLIAWIVRDALGAPQARWIGLNHANAALTVIHYAPGLPARLLFFNDTGHLPAELRWTGFPPEFRI